MFFYTFSLMKRYPKIKALQAFSVFATSGFCHATQAVRLIQQNKYTCLTAALTSAWLEMPFALKTFLELLLKLYKDAPLNNMAFLFPMLLCDVI